MYQHKSTSLADQIFERLENDILIGRYQIGEVLTESKLSEQLGVSRTPIREALRRLQQEKLVSDSSRDSVVLGISKDDIEDIYEIRLSIEPLAVKRFTECVTDEKIDKLKEIIELQEFYCQKGDNEKVIAKDSEFHEFIYSECGSRIIADTLIPLHKKLIKFRKNSIEHTGRAVKSVEEHRMIFDLIQQRDEEAAVAAICRHIKNARASILEGAKE